MEPQQLERLKNMVNSKFLCEKDWKMEGRND
jgi:hypothetical protein